MPANNQHIHLDVDATHHDALYRFHINFLIFKQDSLFIAYCPALDISTSATSFNEAVSNFYEMFQLHIECCLESGTLRQDLLEHGWQLKDSAVEPPAYLSLLPQKPELQEIFDGNQDFESISLPVEIPAFA